ncbi:putative Syntaxin-81 [Nannochloris sp. 'desiccata']|nr:hypothetical protein KSW81_003664 [Chlorella desiccata (nom. nud.)]KAH7615992.1 putative Syntaxin-81 [Chlorella desiccata (nom. nud.)]
MAIDLTGLYWDLVVAGGRANGLDDEGLRKLRSAQLLRSLGSKNTFSKAAAEVQRYAHAGRLREFERDQIEEEVGAYVRACSENIAKLQSMLRTAPTASPAKSVPPSADLMAHRQGSVLILSERLGALASAFDRLRSLRYKQLQQEEANRRRRTPQNTALALPGGGATAGKINSRTAAALAGVGKSVGNQLRAAFDATMLDNGNVEDAGAAFMRPLAAGGRPEQQQQMQSQIDAENLALQAELLSMSDQVQTTEKTVREIATLNQMFSTAILHQSEQIEKLFHEAVAATTTLGRANVQLDKAVKTNKSAQKCMFILLVMASVILLFLDWWYS